MALFADRTTICQGGHRRAMIHPRYESAFASLSAQEVHCVVSDLSRTHQDLLEIGDFEDGMEIVHYCRSQHISQAEVIMALSRDIRPEAVTAVEKIIMRPIDRRSPAEVERERDALRPRPVIVAPVRTRDSETDERLIRILAGTCPKRSGTKSAELWLLYHDGQTVAEYLGGGGTRAALQWDQERGYIRIDPPAHAATTPSAA